MAAMREKVVKHLVWLWVLIPLIAIAEVILQVAVPLMEPSDSEWRKASQYAISIKKENDLILFAPNYATQAVVYLDDALSEKDFGYFDASRYLNLIEIAVGDASAPETKGLVLTNEKSFGRIIVRQFRNPTPADVRYDFVDNAEHAQMETGRPLKPALVVDTEFRPRFAIPMSPKGRPHAISFEEVPLGGEIYGYAFIQIVDFRREIYDKDGPLEFEVFVDGKSIGKKVVRKTDEMVPFRFKTNSTKSGSVRFQVRSLNTFKNYGFAFVADVRE